MTAPGQACQSPGCVSRGAFVTGSQVLGLNLLFLAFFTCVCLLPYWAKWVR